METVKESEKNCDETMRYDEINSGNNQQGENQNGGQEYQDDAKQPPLRLAELQNVRREDFARLEYKCRSASNNQPRPSLDDDSVMNMDSMKQYLLQVPKQEQEEEEHGQEQQQQRAGERNLQEENQNGGQEYQDDEKQPPLRLAELQNVRREDLARLEYECRSASNTPMDKQPRPSLDGNTVMKMVNMKRYLLQVPKQEQEDGEQRQEQQQQRAGDNGINDNGVEVIEDVAEIIDLENNRHNHHAINNNQEMTEMVNNQDCNDQHDENGYTPNGIEGGDCMEETALSRINNESEIMRAARALFSKRTRTLYHWMYPDTPKMQLKTVVAEAWDAMIPGEKQFYISQVLGKFGSLQSQLMVNPQVGIIATGRATTSTSQTLSSHTQTHTELAHAHTHASQSSHTQTYSQTMRMSLSNVEAPKQNYGLFARPKLPLSIAPPQAQRVYTQTRTTTSKNRAATDPYYMHPYPVPYSHPHVHAPYYARYSPVYGVYNGYDFMRGVGPIRRRRGRPRRATTALHATLQSIYMQRLQAMKQLAESTAMMPSHLGMGVGMGMGMSAVQSNSMAAYGPQYRMEEEFNDDPELQNEFEKFQWTLHMTD